MSPPPSNTKSDAQTQAEKDRDEAMKQAKAAAAAAAALQAKLDAADKAMKDALAKGQADAADAAKAAADKAQAQIDGLAKQVQDLLAQVSQKQSEANTHAQDTGAPPPADVPVPDAVIMAAQGEPVRERWPWYVWVGGGIGALAVAKVVFGR